MEIGEPVVVIFDIKTLPHTFWLLVDEAEFAVIGAGFYAVKDYLRKFYSEWFIVVFFYFKDFFFSVLVFDVEFYFFCAVKELVVEDITQFCFVERQNFITCLESQIVGNGIFFDCGYYYFVIHKTPVIK